MKANIINFGPIFTGKTFCSRMLGMEYPDKLGKIRKGAGFINILTTACEPGWEATNGDLTCE